MHFTSSVNDDLAAVTVSYIAKMVIGKLHDTTNGTCPSFTAVKQGVEVQLFFRWLSFSTSSHNAFINHLPAGYSPRSTPLIGALYRFHTVLRDTAKIGHLKRPNSINWVAQLSKLYVFVLACRKKDSLPSHKNQPTPACRSCSASHQACHFGFEAAVLSSYECHPSRVAARLSRGVVHSRLAEKFNAWRKCGSWHFNQFLCSPETNKEINGRRNKITHFSFSKVVRFTTYLQTNLFFNKTFPVAHQWRGRCYNGFECVR